MPVWKELFNSMMQRGKAPRTSDIDLSPRRPDPLPYNLRDPRPATVEAENAIWKGGPRPRTKDIDLSIKELLAKEEAKQPFGPVNEESEWSREDMPVPPQEREKLLNERGMSEGGYKVREHGERVKNWLQPPKPMELGMMPSEQEYAMGILGMGTDPREEDINLPGRSASGLPQTQPLPPYQDIERNFGREVRGGSKGNSGMQVDAAIRRMVEKDKAKKRKK